MPRRYDHTDLRVRDLRAARAFYEALLPALGFTRRRHTDGYLQFEIPAVTGATEFVGITESPHHAANENRIAFWCESRDEVNRIAAIAVRAGAREVEGPEEYEGTHYYAVFFEDSDGNRFELCSRTENS